jgi:hypothetical protein
VATGRGAGDEGGGFAQRRRGKSSVISREPAPSLRSTQGGVDAAALPPHSTEWAVVRREIAHLEQLILQSRRAGREGRTHLGGAKGRFNPFHF